MIKHGYNGRFYDIPPLDTVVELLPSWLSKDMTGKVLAMVLSAFKGVILMDHSPNNWLCTSP